MGPYQEALRALGASLSAIPAGHPSSLSRVGSSEPPERSESKVRLNPQPLSQIESLQRKKRVLGRSNFGCFRGAEWMGPILKLPAGNSWIRNFIVESCPRLCVRQDATGHKGKSLP